MIISLLAAVDRNNVIGKAGRLPWHLPCDLAYFKKVTMGHTIVMGRKTYLAIGRALPGRENVIMTRGEAFSAEGCIIMHSVDEVFNTYRNSSEELFIIGGGEIFEQFIELADRLYITLVDHEFDGDTYFPDLDMKQWVKISETKGIVDSSNVYKHTYYIYENNGKIK